MDIVGNRTLRDLLDERVARYGDKPFLVFEDKDGNVSEATYSAFQTRVDRVAAGLTDLGVGPGDKVAVHLANCPEILEVWFALGTLGAVMVPSNTANTPGELEYLLDFSGAVAIVTQPAFLSTVSTAVDEVPAVRHRILARTATAAPGTLLLEDLVSTTTVAPRPKVNSEDVVQMLFTSGTTARPKGVLLTHANALHGGERESRGLLLDDTDRCMTSLPLFHVNAQVITMLSSLTVGATCIVLEEFRATKYWDQLRRHRATQTSLVAMQVRTLLAQPERETDRSHALRRTFYALNISTEEKDAFQDRYGVELINAYGLSEAMTLATLAPVFGPKKWPSIGKPLVGRTIRLVDPDGNDVPVGTVGEIVIHGVPGRTLMKGYYRNPEATADALRDGELWTGDNAYADDDGYFYWFDRRSDMIKRAGENISTVEVESVIVEHPEVAEVAVIGVPDPLRDEAVKAVLVLEPGSRLTAEDVREHCEGRLAAFKIPTVIEIRDALPKTSIGKVAKGELRKEARTE
ncbi:ATP-dependent acyl-CoA ligase [Nocardioides immobilis]|uniref:ATP-dependent acyl-CoA ligase n=1 Tax=Nocardioides immobilis TaxID=2049295 RepID=A0A417Y743_9ACTN|nr:AMP-binding protein [Nocardioides immobilis]RHW28387.1 ATP-dependent acyl-CoA ligase [Nocardioides immobilis]